MTTKSETLLSPKALLLTTALLLSGVPIAGSVLAQAPADTDAGPDCAIPTQDDKCEDWVGREGRCGSCPLAVSPDSEQVYVSFSDTIAFDASTGERQWASDVSGSYMDVSPDGDRIVLVSGYRATALGPEGEILWESQGETAKEGSARAVAIGPNNERAYITGTGGTLALDLVTGEDIWYVEEGAQGGLPWDGGGVDVFPSPDGETVYVAVESGNSEKANGFVALDASTGQTQRTAEAPDTIPSQVYSASLSPDGDVLVLTGDLPSGGAGAITAFDTTKGEVLWNVPIDAATGDSSITPWNSVVGPNSQTVFVEANARAGGTVYVIAFDAHTGEQHWMHQEPGRSTAWLDNIAVSPDGSSVYTAFTTNVPPPYEWLWRFRSDVATLSLDAQTGEQEWKATYNGGLAGSSAHAPSGVRTSPDGSHVYVAASSPNLVEGFFSGTPLEQGRTTVVAYEATGPGLELPSQTGGPVR